MHKQPELEHAPDNTYEVMDNLLGNAGGLSITSPDSDHCAFIMRWNHDSDLPEITVSLHNLNPHQEIRLVRVSASNEIPLSIPPETVSPRRNAVEILKGIGSLMEQPGTIVRPIR